MKTFKSLSLLLGTIVFLLTPEPSYSKQVWLLCKFDWTNLLGNTFEKLNNGTEMRIKLDYAKETYEIEWLGEMQKNNLAKGGKNSYYGKATFLASQINFEGYVFPHDTPLLSTFAIDRTSLKFNSNKITGGSCRVVPAAKVLI